MALIICKSNHGLSAHCAIHPGEMIAESRHCQQHGSYLLDKFVRFLRLGQQYFGRVTQLAVSRPLKHLAAAMGSPTSAWRRDVRISVDRALACSQVTQRLDAGDHLDAPVYYSSMKSGSQGLWAKDPAFARSCGPKYGRPPLTKHRRSRQFRAVRLPCTARGSTLRRWSSSDLPNISAV